MICKSSARTKRDKCCSQNTSRIKIGICIYKMSLLHRRGNYIGFTPTCLPHILQQSWPMRLYMGVVLSTHPVHGQQHIQRNANGEVATTSPPFYNKTHQSHVLFVTSAPGTTRAGARWLEAPRAWTLGP